MYPSGNRVTGEGKKEVRKMQAQVSTHVTEELLSGNLDNIKGTAFATLVYAWAIN